MDESVQGHRQRLRERFLRHGFDGFHDYEVLELLLTYAIPRVDVKPIAKRALELDAKGMILFHNHPGGTPHASREDIELTKRMAEACAALDIKILDHFLIAGKEELSFKESGWY